MFARAISLVALAASVATLIAVLAARPRAEEVTATVTGQYKVYVTAGPHEFEWKKRLFPSKEACDKDLGNVSMVFGALNQNLPPDKVPALEGIAPDLEHDILGLVGVIMSTYGELPEIVVGCVPAGTPA